MPLDTRTLADLVTFARIEVESRDVEPWADIMEELWVRGALDQEQAIWLLTLYNTYDDLGSAWACFKRWPSPEAWALAADRSDVASYPLTQERRSLRGGKVIQRFSSYVEKLMGLNQATWMMSPVNNFDPPGVNFARLTEHMRAVWGVGRQSAFEWAEFVGKILEWPVDAADGQLWESSGPRRALERIYGNDHPTPEWLDQVANECKDHLEHEGVPLSWVDFETIICDFNVMRGGRYYPGRHLAALREEIELATINNAEDRALWMSCFWTVVPEPWSQIAPGINKRLMPIYRDTGKIIDHPDPRRAL